MFNSLLFRSVFHFSKHILIGLQKPRKLGDNCNAENFTKFCFSQFLFIKVIIIATSNTPLNIIMQYI